MLSGNEWVVLVVVPLVIALVVVMIVLAARNGGSRRGAETVRVRGETDSVIQDLQLALAGVKGTSVRRDSGGVITLERSMTPTWAIVVAVVFFPIGLVALVARTVETATIAATDSGDGTTTLRMAGTFRKRAASAVNTVIDTRS